MALQGFQEEYYLEAKLAALQATYPEWGSRSAADLKTFLADVGLTPEEHYQQHGWQEGLAPNAYFNEDEYVLAKATDLFNAEGSSYGSIDAAKAAFLAAWTDNPYLHYLQYGSAEGINPSNSFDESSYLEDKLAALQADDPGTYGDWTVDDLADYFAANGMSALGHFIEFGEDEGLEPTSVPTDEQVHPGGGGGEVSDTFTLTVNADNLTGNSDDNVYTAPVVQNDTGSGELANTFETGDVIDGAAGRNILRADLIDSGSISDGVSAPAISATTSNIQEVYFRAQTPQTDGGVNLSTIDAEKMTGVEQWWSDNSRSDIQIEDIRSLPADTTFGMRGTDPRVSLTSYFNAESLTGTIDAGSSSFSFQIAETGNAAAEIANINVMGINFTYEGVDYSLDGDDVAAADTWSELQTALQAQVDAEADLDGLVVTHVGNGTFTVVDNNAGTFEIVPEGTVVTASTVSETKAASLDMVAPVEGPTMTNVILDLAGNGSQGGTLNIGAMSGLRGVEIFDVTVDNDSHLTLMQSANRVAPNNGDPNEFLQVVNLASTGANGDLQIGDRTAFLDGRAALSVDGDASGLVTDNALVDNLSGLYNVIEVNGSAFAGALNVAIALDDNAIGRYLDPLTEETAPASFIYTAGAQNDIFNIADLSTAGAVSSDQDFEMQVDMGAGDDRLVINVPFVSAVSVDGGTGENSIVVAQSHGTNARNTFEAFAGFQTYEVEGNAGATAHDFTSMPGIENVVIATNGGVNTQLIDLEAAQNVTITGKNQTIGNNSTANQLFGVIRMTNDAGADRTVTLDNTARLSNSVNDVRQDGILRIQQLLTDQTATGTSATRNLTIDSSGERTVANTVANFNGRDVQTLDLVGTQDLTFNIAQIADQAAAAGVTVSTALDIDGSELEGDLNLAITGAMIGNWGTAAGLTDSIVGTDGDSDSLMLWGRQGGTNVTVTEFETVQLGSFGYVLANPGSEVLDDGTVVPLPVLPLLPNTNTMFGDLEITAQASGTLNASNIGTNDFIIADVDDAFAPGAADLYIASLSGGTTIALGDEARNAGGNRVGDQILAEVISLTSVATTPATAVDVLNLNVSGVIDNGAGNAMTILVGDNAIDNAGVAIAAGTGGFKTINLDIERDITVGTAAVDATVIDLGVGTAARTLDITGGTSRTNDNLAAVADTLNLNGDPLLNSLELIDISDYNGQVTMTMGLGALGVGQTDVEFVMSKYSADVTLNDGAVNFTNLADDMTPITHNSILRFTEDNGVDVTAAASLADIGVGATGLSIWTVENFVADGYANATLNNMTRLDLTDLGITRYDQVDIAFDGVNTVIRSEAQVNNNEVTWMVVIDDAIDLTGVGSITSDNFIFA